jgi:hypothetical protein
MGSLSTSPGTTAEMIAAKDIDTVTYRFDEDNAVSFLVHGSIMTNPAYQSAFDSMVIEAYSELIHHATNPERPRPKPVISVFWTEPQI